MKQIIALIIFNLLVYCTFLISTPNINGSNFLNKMNRAFKGMLFVVPIVSLIAGVFFLIFELFIYILKLNINFFDVFLVSLYGVFIIFIGDFLVKNSVLKLYSNRFSKKYGGENLKKEEMDEIYNKNKNKINLTKNIFMFFISFILYFVVLICLMIKVNIIFILICTFINLLTYSLFFRNNKSHIKSK